MDISLGALDRAISDERVKFDVMKEIAGVLSCDLERNSNLPEVSTDIFRLISDRTGVPDPFKAEKDECNRISMPIAERLSPAILGIEDSVERLRSGALATIAGNTMDLGTSGHNFELSSFEEEYGRIIENGLAIDDTGKLYELLNRSKTVLYLADNAGEIAFDKILVKIIQEIGPRVTVVVKGGPISNDATIEDAHFVGIDEIADLITTGADYLGVSFKESSEDFLEKFDSSDLIVSKGQSNLETLSHNSERIKRPVAYILKAKCPPIANALGCMLGDNVLRVVEPV
jgi:uncharacterized protein with ATP-grasp and redox domains